MIKQIPLKYWHITFDDYEMKITNKRDNMYGGVLWGDFRDKDVFNYEFAKLLRGVIRSFKTFKLGEE